MQSSHGLPSRRKVERVTPRRSQGRAASPSNMATRRRTRQKRRVETRRTEETSSSVSSKLTIQKQPLRRRYVKSKPPKLMPGGRVICAGKGTLTEVSKSFYVAYGSMELGDAMRELHLVVPVKDELQEVTDDESPTPTFSDAAVASRQGSALGRRGRENSGVDLSCGSMMLDSPRMGSIDDATFLAALHSGLSPKPSAAQLPLNWYGTPPWTNVKPSVTPFTAPFESNVAVDELLGEMLLPRSMRPQSQERDGAAAFSPRDATTDGSLRTTDDRSYFHLADALMPETKPSRAPVGRSLGESLPSRCGMTPGEAPSFLPGVGPFPYPSHLSFQQLMQWDHTDPYGLGPMGPPPQLPPASLSSFPRRPSDLNSAALGPQSAFLADPTLRPHSSLLI